MVLSKILRQTYSCRLSPVKDWGPKPVSATQKIGMFAPQLFGQRVEQTSSIVGTSGGR
jgi:hypothetical protein